MAGNAGDGDCPSAAEGADHAPVKVLIHGQVTLLRGKGRSEKCECGEELHENDKTTERQPQELNFHECPHELVRINQTGEIRAPIVAGEPRLKPLISAPKVCA